MKNRFCVIGVYFGKLPCYFPLWLKSCENNEKIDFHIFTDQHIETLPKNVKVHALTLEQMQLRATAVLGFDACLQTPYKCCDYKVLYGLIFQEFVSEYTYWGHCDFDLIFGDLYGFFQKYQIERYDRFLALGHLAMYRNTEEVNRRYISPNSGIDFQKYFTSDDIYGVDELKGLQNVYLKKELPVFTKRVFADISSAYSRYRLIRLYPLDERPENYPLQIFYWENGKTYRAYYDQGKLFHEEYAYIHFQKRPDFRISFDPASVSAFYITNQGFIPKNSPVTEEICKMLNPYRGRFHEILEQLRFRTKRVLYHVKSAWQKLCVR